MIIVIGGLSKGMQYWWHIFLIIRKVCIPIFRQPNIPIIVFVSRAHNSDTTIFRHFESHYSNTPIFRHFESHYSNTPIFRHFESHYSNTPIFLLINYLCVHCMANVRVRFSVVNYCVRDNTLLRLAY